MLEGPDGVLAGLSAGKIWLEMSTTDAAEALLWHSDYALSAALWVIAVGALITCVARTRALAHALEARPRP